MDETKRLLSTKEDDDDDGGDDGSVGDDLQNATVANVGEEKKDQQQQQQQQQVKQDNSIQLQQFKHHQPSTNTGKVRHRNPPQRIQSTSTTTTNDQLMALSSPLPQPTSSLIDVSEAGSTSQSSTSSTMHAIGGTEGGGVGSGSGASTSTTRYGTLQSSGFKRTLQVDTRYPRTYFTKKQFCIAAISMLLFVAAVTVTLVFGLPRLEAKREEYFAAKHYSSPLPELVHHRYTVLVSDNDYASCPNVGLDILEHQQGSTMDAALATLFCLMMASPHLVGLDSGFRGLIHTNQTMHSFRLDEQLLRLENVSISSPVLPVGAKQLHERFGRLSWPTILQPSYQLARNGVPVSETFAQLLHQLSPSDMNFKAIQKLFIHNDNFNQQQEDNTNNKTEQQRYSLLNNGELYKNIKLANILESIANINGSMTNGLIFNITDNNNNNNNGIIIDLLQQLNSINDSNQTITLEQLRSLLLIDSNRQSPANQMTTIDQPLRFSLFQDALRLYSGNEQQQQQQQPERPTSSWSSESEHSSNYEVIALAQMLNVLQRLIYSIDDSNIIEMCAKNGGRTGINGDDGSTTTLKQTAIQLQYILDTMQFGSSTLAKLRAGQANASEMLHEHYLDWIVQTIEKSIQNQWYQRNDSFYDMDPTILDRLLQDQDLSGNNVQIIVSDAQTDDVVILTTSKRRNLFDGEPKFVSEHGGFVLDMFDGDHKPPASMIQWPVLVKNPKQEKIYLALGSTGGSGSLQPLYATVQVLQKLLFNCQTLKSSIDESRMFYHPKDDSIYYEANYPQAYIDLLIRMFLRTNLKPNTMQSKAWHDSGVYAVMMTAAVANSIAENPVPELRSMIDYRLNGYISGH